MGNDVQFDILFEVIVDFFFEGLFDYFFVLVILEMQVKKGCRFFCYFNMWRFYVYGVFMCKFFSKLGRLKKVFKVINKDNYVDIEKEVKRKLEILK